MIVLTNEAWIYMTCFPEEWPSLEAAGWEKLGDARPALGGWQTFLLRRRIS